MLGFIHPFPNLFLSALIVLFYVLYRCLCNILYCICSTGVGSLFLLQVIFPTQGLNPGLPHCRRFFTSWATREAIFFPSKYLDQMFIFPKLKPFAYKWVFLVAQMVKNPPAMRETWVQSPGWEDPLEKGMVLPTPVFLPGEFHGQRSLAGYSPLGRKESDMTEQLSLFTFAYK